MQKPEGLSLMIVELGALFCLTHLVAFVVFAFIRILSGISIQRLGYFSLRHISFTLKTGIQVDIRRIELNFHRPSFSRPSWITFTIADSSLYFDSDYDAQSHITSANSPPQTPTALPALRSPDGVPEQSLEYLLTRAASLIYRIHKWLPYLRLIDISIRNSSLITEDLGTIHIRSIALNADVINRNAQLPHFFSTSSEHHDWNRDTDVAVSWRFAVKDIFYAHSKTAADQVLDVFQFDLHEIFTKKTLQPKDVSLNVRVGNLTFPYDSFSTMHARMHARKRRLLRRASTSSSYFVSPALSRRTSVDDVYPQELADTAYALLNIVREVRIHAAKIGIYKFTPSSSCQTTSKGEPIYFSLATKDFTIDLRRLSSNSPGHRIYFEPNDMSHQAILTAISIAVGLNDCASGRQDELLYIPMITTTSTTNFIRKSIQILTREETDRNSSLLKGSLTISSPSVDVHARHLPIFAAIIETSVKSSNSRPKIRGRRIHIGQLLPKIIMKLSVEEPAARIMVSDSEVEFIGQTRAENYSKDSGIHNLLASSCSTINCELESSHITSPTPHYGLIMSFRVTDFGTWVRGPDGIRHDLVRTETLALKFVAETSPGFDVAITGTLASFGIYLTKPEIINSLKDLLAHVRREAQRMERNTAPKPLSIVQTRGDKNFVRQLPSWLSHVKIEGSDVMMCSSCVDDISKDAQGIARGTAVQIESWILEYKPHVSVPNPSKYYRHHHGAMAHSTNTVEFPHAADSDGGAGAGTAAASSTNRRRLAVGFRGVEACVMDANDILDQTTPICTIPDVEMAVSTYSEDNCPVIEVNMLLKKMLVNYSLFHHYSLMLSTKALLQIFGRLRKSPTLPEPAPSTPSVHQLVYIDVRTHNIRLRATLPGSSPLMLETIGLDFTKRTTGIPLLRSKYIRLFVASPTVPDAWERFIVIRHFRLEFKNKHPKPAGVPPSKQEEPNAPEDDVVVDADAISVAIPYGLLLYQVVEGLINSMKSLKQLHHEFKTNSDSYILTPVAEKPKKVPRIRVRPKVLEMRIDDDPFESRLGLIFRIGLLEMKSRLAREAAFEAKVQALQTASTKRDETAAEGAGESGEREASADPEIPEGQEPIRKRSTFKSMKSSRHKHGRQKRNGTAPIRYSPTDAELPSDSAKISTAAAYEKLKELHSQAWIKRITRARKCRADAIESRRMRLIGPDDVDENTASHERIIGIPDSPPLFQILFNDVNILIDKPTYPLDDLHKFLHDIGKGLPDNTQYTLLVPFSFQLELGEARVLLRDYPLPLIHVPALNPAQDASGLSWSMSSDVVIAEEIFDSKSARYVKVPIVPAFSKCDNEYSITVTRTVSAVKLYSKINVDIMTSAPTRITWAPSIQPAIQQVMMVFDTFTKPPIDPSEKIGFWDKIRLIFHSRIRFAWKEGAVHLLLKGSRDPYDITRSGAGFAMCWRNNVTWDINPTGDQKEFMMVDSEEYLLTIPDFTYYVRMNNAKYEATEDDKSTFSAQSEYQDRATFQKIIMKLSGRVRWQAGILFERDDGGQRFFDFIPHYKVQLRTPQSIDNLKTHDSYAAFRSNYIHLALSVISPRDQQWDAFESKPSTSSYNTIHLSPRVFTHFFAWWDLFSGEMSLPIKNGPLFSPQTVSKKFSRHLATIKYQFVLAPLFMSHMYLHKRDDNWSKMVINSIGFKGRTDSFMMDIHQRREFTTYIDKVLNVTRRRRRMRINATEVDFNSADIRGVTVTFKERTAEELFKQLSNPNESQSESPVGSTNGTPLLAKFKVSDNDLTWIDMDDYTELDSLVGSSNLSSVKVLPWLYTPRFTYYRHTEHVHSETGSTAEHISNMFGKEPSHNCLLGQTNALRTQTELISARARELEEQINSNAKQLDDLQRKARLYTENTIIKQKFVAAKKDAEILQYKRQTLHHLWLNLLQYMNEDTKEDIKKCEQAFEQVFQQNGLFAGDKLDSSKCQQSVQGTGNDHFSDFNNRFIFHNVQIKWTNSIRNIFLRYVHQVGQRRGLIYYMSRRAVKFLEDLVKEQQEAKQAAEMASEIAADGANSTAQLDESEKMPMPSTTDALSREDKGKQATEDMIELLLQDSKKHFVVEDEEHQNAKKANQKSKNNGHHHSHHHHQVHHQRRSVHLENADDNPSDSTALAGDSLPIPISATSNTSSRGASISSTSNFASAVEENSSDDEESSSDFGDEEDGNMTDDMLKNLADAYVAHNSYMIRFVGPQIQLQSDKNPNSVLLVTSRSIELKIISIMDKAELEDDVSGLVQSRYCANLDNAQFFVFHKDKMVRQSQWLFASNEYGSTRLYTGGQVLNPTSSTASMNKLMSFTSIWPPWVPLESIYDAGALQDSQIAEKTSASLVFDKHNSLRLKYGDKVVGKSKLRSGNLSDSERRVDRLSVDFPKVVASCDSLQYYAVYIIVMDLLIYSEPHYKRSNERLERIVFATDFSDLSGASDMVENLQREIRQLEEIRYQFQIYTSDLDEQGWRDRRNVQMELSYACEELFFIMKAITTGQRRLEDKESETTGVLQWFITGQQIIAHLLLADRTPFVDIALAKGTFRRLENSDGSNFNTIEVAMLQGINLLKSALYPELLSPYFDAMSEEDKNRKAVRVYWYMLEAIGGIPVMDHFEVDLIPLKIQLEYDIGQKLFQYIFPDEKESPFMVYEPPPAAAVSITPHADSSTPNISMDANPSTAASDTSDSSSQSDSDGASIYSQRSQRSLFFGKNAEKKRPTGGGLASWTGHRRRTSSSVTAASERKFSLGGNISASRDPTSKFGDSVSVKSYVSVQSETKLQQTITAVGVRNHGDSHYGLEDDLSQMVTRASNFITFVHVTIPSVVLCLSYKGRGSRNIEDVHEFVFRTPTIEYRNKTWSNLDLALRLKKDIIKALISHTGALIENKFKSRGSSSKRRQQQPMIRQISDYAAFTSLADLSESNLSRKDGTSHDRVN